MGQDFVGSASQGSVVFENILDSWACWNLTGKC